nr:hypothetical protein [Polycipiviridae sp.]
MLQQQNEQLPPSTTDPRRPDGQTPTQPPLSTSAQVGTGPSDYFNVIANPLDILKGYPIYIDRFIINNVMPIGTVLYQFDTALFLREIQTFRRLPWQLMTFIFSQRNSFKISLKIVPVKLGEAPVVIDAFFNYNRHRSIATFGAFNLDYNEINITKSEPFDIELPQFYMVDQINTYGPPVPNETNSRPAYIPNTSVTIRTKSPYMPTLMHPPSFECLVFMTLDFQLSEQFIPLASDLINLSYNSYPSTLP